MAERTSAVEIAVVKKLTTKAMGLQTVELQDIAAEHGMKKPVSIARVYGMIKKSEPKTTSIGVSQCYTGEFEAVNLISGAKFRASTMYVPGVAEVVLDQLLASAQLQDKSATAQFGFDLTIQYYDNKNPTGTRFTFGVKPLLQPEESDPLSKMAKMLEEVAGAPKFLALPEVAEKAPAKGKK